MNDEKEEIPTRSNEVGERNAERKYRIRIKKGDIEMEIEGDKNFVSTELKDLKDSILSVQQVPIKDIIETETSEISQISDESESLQTRISNFSNKLGVSTDQLEHIFKFEEDYLTLLTAPTDKKTSVKQQKSTLAILTAYKNCYGEEKTIASELTRNLKRVGISTSNLSPNLQKMKSEIIVDGKRGSRNMAYTLTAPGGKRGIEVINELVSYIQA